MNPEFIAQIEPPILSLENTEPITVIKNEPIDYLLDSLDEEINSDIKDGDIVSHILWDSIKSEIVPQNILESKHSEAVETQVLVKTENAPFVKIEDIFESVIKTEGTSDGNGQEVIEFQGNLETYEQHVLNFSNELNGISRSPKSEHPEKTDFAECYRTTSWEEVKEKIKVIKAPVIHVEPHEYTSLGKDKHVCNHCQHAFKTLYYAKCHIKKIHRKAFTMYQCPYCPYKVKVKSNLYYHIIHKHKDTEDIQWLQYHYCDKCDYKTFTRQSLNTHKLNHLKPQEIPYFYCCHCSYKSKQRSALKEHIFRLHFKNVEFKLGRKCENVEIKPKRKCKNVEIKQKKKKENRFHCDQCDYKTYLSQLFKWHKLNHLKPEEIQYVYCYLCSYKSKHKAHLKTHILGQHFKNVEIKLKPKRYPCDQCDYKTWKYSHLNRHKLIHLKPEESRYFYCFHCPFKTRHKTSVKAHILRHFEKGEIKFHCYICDFMTLKRDLIIDHIKKHSKVQIKSEINQ